MNCEIMYEELRKQWPDCLTKTWDQLVPNEQVFWVRFFARIDNTERELKKAKEIIGHLVMSSPEILPIIEA